MQILSQLALVALIPLLGRTVPVLGYCIVSSGRSVLWRLGWVVVLVSTYCALGSVTPSLFRILIDVALTNGWLLVGAFGLNAYVRHAGKVPRVSSLVDGVLALLIGLVVPLRIFPTEMWPLVGPLGWEYGLAGYSYIRRARGQTSKSVRDCVFFLLVNPMLVFDGHRARGELSARERTHAALRLAAGYAAVLVGVGIQRVAAAAGSLTWLAATLFVVVQYATHSGRASQDIGLLRLLGYTIPERYHYPFAARNPQAFWTRWNSYVGCWARAYLFVPASRGFRRLGASQHESVVMAVLVTFGGVGLIHEAVLLWNSRIQPFGFTAWFALNGILLLIWRAAEAWSGSQERSRRVVQLLAWGAAIAAMGLAAQDLLSG